MNEAIDGALGASVGRLQSMRSAARERVAAFSPGRIADQVVSAARFVMRTAVRE
jgi:hypothetical protein